MSTDVLSLMTVYKGWDGHQVALVQAVSPLSPEQLAWQPAPHLRSVGELVAHIVTGRIRWIHDILGVESPEVSQWIEVWGADTKSSIFSGTLKSGAEQNTAALVSGLESTWKMIENVLIRWTTEDLGKTIRHVYQGKTWALSRQWILWRMMDHDIHHGGELALMLGLQGIPIPELGDLGGHLTAPSQVEETSPDLT